jgi:hypothetical protein
MRSAKVYLMNPTGELREPPRPTCNITICVAKELVIAEPSGTLVTGSSIEIELWPGQEPLEVTLLELIRREER